MEGFRNLRKLLRIKKNDESTIHTRFAIFGSSVFIRRPAEKISRYYHNTYLLVCQCAKSFLTINEKEKYSTELFFEIKTFIFVLLVFIVFQITLS
jgi:hypothetical protein